MNLRMLKRFALAFSVIGASLFVPGLASPASASAADTQCSDDSGANTRQITFSGSSEATFHVETCFDVTGEQDWWPFVKIWIGDGDHDYPASGAFKTLSVNVVLQSNNNTIWQNTGIGSCDALAAMNSARKSDGTLKYTSASNAYICGVRYPDSGVAGPVAGPHIVVTTDGWIDYTTATDSADPWNLHGSPGCPSHC